MTEVSVETCLLNLDILLFSLNLSYTRYVEKLFSQIYKDLYGDAMLVPIQMGANMAFEG